MPLGPVRDPQLRKASGRPQDLCLEALDGRQRAGQVGVDHPLRRVALGLDPSHEHVPARVRAQVGAQVGVGDGREERIGPGEPGGAATWCTSCRIGRTPMVKSLSAPARRLRALDQGPAALTRIGASRVSAGSSASRHTSPRRATARTVRR